MSEAAAENAPPASGNSEAGGANEQHINIKVQGQDGSIVHFKIKKASQLKKLITAYCDRLGVNPDSVRFMFDGQVVQASDTPNGLSMENGDTIEVFQQQTGGAR